HGPALEHAARGVPEGHGAWRSPTMSGAVKLQIAAFSVALALEVLTRTGIVSSFTIIPPSQMAIELYRLLASGRIFPDIRSTMSGVVMAAISAIVTGFLFGAVIHGLP